MNKIIYNKYNNQFINNQVNIKNVIPTPIFKQSSTNYNEYIPVNYILSLTKLQRRIFNYLLRFRPRGTFRLYMIEIAQYAKCSIKTAQRATNKFHHDGVITKIQIPNCFAANIFTIENKIIFDLDKSYSKKMSDININIQSIYIYKQTDRQYSHAREPNLSFCQKKEIDMNLDLQLSKSLQQLSDKIGLTIAGKIDLIGFPEDAIKFAMDNLSSSAKTRDKFKVVCFFAHLWCKQNNQKPITSKVRELSVLFNVNVDDKRIDEALIVKSKISHQKSIETKGSAYVPWKPKEPTRPLPEAHILEKVSESLKTDAGKMMLTWLNITPEQYIQNQLIANNALREKHNKWLEQCGDMSNDVLSQKGIA